jgi:hypothetical protein
MSDTMALAVPDTSAVLHVDGVSANPARPLLNRFEAVSGALGYETCSLFAAVAHHAGIHVAIAGSTMG